MSTYWYEFSLEILALEMEDFHYFYKHVPFEDLTSYKPDF